MATSEFVVGRSTLRFPPERVSAWYARPGAATRLRAPFSTALADAIHTVTTVKFEPRAGGCMFEQRVPLDHVAGLPDILRVLAYRHATLVGEMNAHARVGDRRLRVAIAGASGLIGSNLAAFLAAGGHD